MSPAPDRRRDRYCRTTRWRTRANLAPSPILDRVWPDLISCRPIILFAKPPDQVGDMRWYALADDVVVHRPQLLADARLHLSAEPYLAFSVGGWFAHVFPGLRLIRIRRRRWNVDCFAAHFRLAPIANVQWCNLSSPFTLAQRAAIALVPGLGT